jgi:hypothetical protein
VTNRRHAIIAQMKRKPADASALIERVRKIALELPGTSEKLSHGEPAFFVRSRMFCTIDNNHHGSGHVAAWINAPEGAQETLVSADPDHFFVPPYLGKGGWVGIRIDGDLAWTTIADLLSQAHEITGVRKKRSLI